MRKVKNEKKIKFSKLLTFLFIAILSTGCTKSNVSMPNTPYFIPLKIGLNSSFKYEALEINPINLFVDSDPAEGTKGIQVQLELHVRANNKNNKTFLWNQNKDQKTNYPQVFGKYLFSLSISKDNNVALIIDTLDYGKPFFIHPAQYAVIQDLSISFKTAEDITAYSDPEMEVSESYMEYEITLSDNENTEESITFDSLDKNELLLKWNNYDIKILDLNWSYLEIEINKNKY